MNAIADELIGQRATQGIRVSVVVPHLNQPDALEACLKSLDDQSLDRSDFEVIVVDNGSTTMPEVIIARHAGVRLLRELVPGPGPARNAGIRAAQNQIFAFIDADCRAHPDWLRVAISTILAAPTGTVLGGDVRIWHEGKTITWIEAYESVFAYQFKRYIERQGFSGTGNLVVRRDDFEKVGPFGGLDIAEDIDWGHRARRAGLTLRYVPEMIVFHPPRRSFAELCVKWDRHLVHNVNVMRRKPGWQLRWIARSVLIAASPAIDVFKVATSDRLSGITARLKAALVLIAIREYRALLRLKLLLVARPEVSWNRDPKQISDVE